MSSPYDLMGGGQEIATDTKEVGYNPQTGEIKINPKYGKEGSDLIHRIAQPGEYWFGKLVNPETGNTFKEDARSIIKKGEVKGTRAKFQDKRTAKINNENVLEQLDVLADAQNRVHQEQNTKPKIKNSILAAKNGVKVPGCDTGLTPYSYNTDITQFKYWDKENNDYTEEYKKWVNSLTQQDVDDIVGGKYGDMSTYLKANPNFKMNVDTARRLMTDKKYGDWHKFSQNYVDTKVAENQNLELAARNLPNVRIILPSNINVKDILEADIEKLKKQM